MTRSAGILLALFSLLAGCRSAPVIKPVVGVVPRGGNEQFWQNVHAGANKAAVEYGLEVQWSVPASAADPAEQITIIESLLRQKVGGIVVAPVNRTALVPVVNRASDGGVPVAVIDSGLDTGKRLTFVASDNHEAGKMAAQELGRLMFGKGKVGVVSFMPGSASAAERQEGFAAELAASFPGMKIAEKVYGMADRGKGMAGTEMMLNAHPDLSGLFADNEAGSAAMLHVLKAHRTSRIRTVAFDANDQVIADLQDRALDVMVLQEPFRMGYESVKAIGMKIRGEQPPARIETGVHLVGRLDMEKPDIVQLLRPDLSRWLKNGNAAQ